MPLRICRRNLAGGRARRQGKLAGKEGDVFAGKQKDALDVFAEQGLKNLFDFWDTKKISSNLTPSGRNNKQPYILENAK